MGTIKICRIPHFTFSIRKFKIYINSKFIKSIYLDEIAEIDLSPGSHILQIKVDFYRSNKLKFYISDEEISYFNIYLKQDKSTPIGRYFELNKIQNLEIVKVPREYFKVPKKGYVKKMDLLEKNDYIVHYFQFAEIIIGLVMLSTSLIYGNINQEFHESQNQFFLLFSGIVFLLNGIFYPSNKYLRTLSGYQVKAISAIFLFIFLGIISFPVKILILELSIFLIIYIYSLRFLYSMKFKS